MSDERLQFPVARMRDRFHRIIGSVDGPALWEPLLRAYTTEAPRHYHTLKHIEAGFAYLDEAEKDPRLFSDRQYWYYVKLAWIYHDVVYLCGPEKPSFSNEFASAQWALADLYRIGAPHEAAQPVWDLILYTEKHLPTDVVPLQVMHDLDFSIFGAEKKEFDAYESGIREEYCWAPGRAYVQGRLAFLSTLNSRPYIFQTNHFREQLEVKARENLEFLIEVMNARLSLMTDEDNQ